jgi:hypothetical protein
MHLSDDKLSTMAFVISFEPVGSDVVGTDDAVDGDAAGMSLAALAVDLYSQLSRSQDRVWFKFTVIAPSISVFNTAIRESCSLFEISRILLSSS